LGEGWVCQPILEKKWLKTALIALEKQLQPYLKRGIVPDMHVGNVGWLRENGKMVPKLFDW
jgi:hypothetical protein